MKLIIVAATLIEANFLFEKFKIEYKPKQQITNVVQNKNCKVDVLITGIGLVNTVYKLSQYTSDYDLIINIGIAGSFTKSLQTGETVLVTKDVYADLGLIQENQFYTATELKLVNNQSISFNNKAPHQALINLKKVKAITTNSISANNSIIQKWETIYKPQIETMEGYGVFYVAKCKKKKCLQIRGISNYVGERDKTKWEIGKSIKNYSVILLNYIENL